MVQSVRRTRWLPFLLGATAVRAVRPDGEYYEQGCKYHDRVDPASKFGVVVEQGSLLSCLGCWKHPEPDCQHGSMEPAVASRQCQNQLRLFSFQVSKPLRSGGSSGAMCATESIPHWGTLRQSLEGRDASVKFHGFGSSPGAQWGFGL